MHKENALQKAQSTPVLKTNGNTFIIMLYEYSMALVVAFGMVRPQSSLTYCLHFILFASYSQYSSFATNCSCPAHDSDKIKFKYKLYERTGTAHTNISMSMSFKIQNIFLTDFQLIYFRALPINEISTRPLHRVVIFRFLCSI